MRLAGTIGPRRSFGPRFAWQADFVLMPGIHGVHLSISNFDALKLPLVNVVRELTARITIFHDITGFGKRICSFEESSNDKT